MARKYKRDSKGRFAGSSGGRTGPLKDALSRNIGRARTTGVLAGASLVAQRAGRRDVAAALAVAANVNAQVGRFRR